MIHCKIPWKQIFIKRRYYPIYILYYPFKNFLRNPRVNILSFMILQPDLNFKISCLNPDSQRKNAMRALLFPFSFL